MMGRRVQILTRGLEKAGYRPVQWNSKNEAGEAVSSGVYFYMIAAGEFHQVRKMLLIK
jgi:hypothetical protein